MVCCWNPKEADASGRPPGCAPVTPVILKTFGAFHGAPLMPPRCRLGCDVVMGSENCTPSVRCLCWPLGGGLAVLTWEADDSWLELAVRSCLGVGALRRGGGDMCVLAPERGKLGATLRLAWESVMDAGGGQITDIMPECWVAL